MASHKTRTTSSAMGSPTCCCSMGSQRACTISLVSSRARAGADRWLSLEGWRAWSFSWNSSSALDRSTAVSPETPVFWSGHISSMDAATPRRSCSPASLAPPPERPAGPSPPRAVAGEDPVEHDDPRGVLGEPGVDRVERALGRAHEQAQDQGGEGGDQAGAQLHRVLGIIAQVMLGEKSAYQHADHR